MQHLIDAREKFEQLTFDSVLTIELGSASAAGFSGKGEVALTAAGAASAGAAAAREEGPSLVLRAG